MNTSKKNTSWTPWVCLLSLVVGCGNVNDAGQDKQDDKRAVQGQLALTTPQDNACVNGCTGGVPDGSCDTNENNFTCAQDCACGDGQCSGKETPTNCPLDCKYGTDPSTEDDFCGNTRCEPWEHDGIGLECTVDCDLSPGGSPCGDGDCNLGETSATCRADCGNKATCGNHLCEPEYGETFATCDADCTNFNVPAGRFVGTQCHDYELRARYADGNGAFVDHVVTRLAAGCGSNANDTAFPWKLLGTPSTCNGATLLKPDGSTCTISGAQCATPAPWVAIGTDYVMDSSLNPNQCGLYTIAPGTFQPLAWAKVKQQACTPNAPCTVYQCSGQTNSVTIGSAAVWRPQVGRWSMYAPYCQ